jgi:hypothetical protein
MFFTMDHKSKSGLLYHSGNLQHNDHKHAVTSNPVNTIYSDLLLHIQNILMGVFNFKQEN